MKGSVRSQNASRGPKIESTPLIVPVVLAAGDSARMGYPKALLPLGEKTFLTRILETIQEIELLEPIVVLGKHAARIKPALSNLGVRIVVNQEPSRGQLSSIKLALQAMDSHALGCLVWPVDQPCIPTKLVRDLIQKFVECKAPLLLPQCGDKRGHPAIFDRSLFTELLEAPLERGAKPITFGHQDRIVLLATDSRATVWDIDTPDDYRELTGETLAQALARRGVELE